MKKDLEYIYNLDYVVCVPPSCSEIFYSLEYTFKNVVSFNNSLEDIDFFKHFFKQNNFNNIIFVDYLVEYEEIIQEISGNCNINFIFTKSLSSLSSTKNLEIFDILINKLKNGSILKLGLIDNELYNVLKDDYNVFLLKLESNLNFSSPSIEKQIGVLNSASDFKMSFYNELSAISILRDYKANLLKPNKITKQFCSDYNIKYNKSHSYSQLIFQNEINLYINFTDSNIVPFIDSMNNNIPCILGNNTWLNNYPELKEYLVVESDDDTNEFKDKIINTVKNKSKILKLYKDFYKAYQKELDELRTLFLGTKITEETAREKYDKLLTVVVPIYNVEKYLKYSIESILEASVDNMEILLINDGSTDNSAIIAQKYAKKYPSLIRYIDQSNHGLGNVRNVGLREARGKYIASIDSDDTINYNFFVEALPYLKDDADIVLYDWLSIVPGKEQFTTPALDKSLNCSNEYKQLLYATIMPSACNKIIKTELYKKNNLVFAEGLKFEDLSTNPLILLLAKKIKYINKPYYEYMLRPNSIMRSSINLDMVDIIKMLNNRISDKKLLDKISSNEFCNYVYWWRIEELIINQLYSLDDKDLDKAIKYVNDNIFYILSALFKNNSFVDDTINKFDDETKNYIFKRNEAIINKELSKFIKNSKKDNSYKIITAAMILYNVDNREK